MTEKRADGYRDTTAILSGLGRARYLQGFSLDSYGRARRDGLLGKCIYYPIDTALSGGVSIKDDGDIIDYHLQKLGFTQSLTEAVALARLKGSALIYLTGTKDGAESHAQPINLNLITSVDGFGVSEQVSLEQDTYYTIKNVRYHKSRVFRVADRTDNQEVNTYLLGELERAVAEYNRVTSRIPDMIRRKSQPVMAVSGLNEMVKDVPFEATRIVQEIQQLASGADALEVAMCDANDRFDIVESPLNGVVDLYKELRIKISALAHIPVSHLFGDTPSGLNASGRGDEMVFRTFVNTIRAVYCEPAIAWAVEIVANIADVKAKINEKANNFDFCNIVFDWRDIFEPSDREKAETDKIRADAQTSKINDIILLKENQIITDEEARKMLSDLGMING